MGRPARSNRAVVVHAREDLRVEDLPLAEAADDEAVLRIAYGGICGSDLHYVSHARAGESILREPMVLGHEVVGTVEVAAADGQGPAAGTRVAVHPAGSRVVDGRPVGTYLGSAAHLPHEQGAFAQRVVLPHRMLRPLPEGLSLRSAALAEPAAVAWHAVARAGEVRGRSVLVVGCGPIGLLVVAVLRRAGTRRITVTDLREAATARALALGADEALTPGHEALSAMEADVVLECSGSPRALGTAFAAARRGGVVVLVGLQPSGEVATPLALAITRELDVRGSFRFEGEMEPVLAALADGSLGTDAVVSHELGLEEAGEAFTVAADPARSAKVLLVLDPDADGAPTGVPGAAADSREVGGPVPRAGC